MLYDGLFVSKVTVDQVHQIFVQTLGSVRGSAGIVLWCWANYANLSLDFKTFPTSCWLAAAWCAAVSLWRLLALADALLAGRRFGKWRCDAEQDRVLITGGAHGLGLLLAATFVANGFRTVIFDVDEPEFPIEGELCSFHRVDVSEVSAVEAAIGVLPGGPYIVINCAGVVGESTGRLRSVGRPGIEKVIGTNLLGSVWVTREALCQKEVKMVVGISSTTALACPAEAAVYAASKAGVRAFFASLYHTVRPSTRVLCLTLGQLDTRMFSAVHTPSEFWSPVMRAAPLSKFVYDQIIAGRTGELVLPLYGRLLLLLPLLPRSLVELLRRWVGIDTAMNTS